MRPSIVIRAGVLSFLITYLLYGFNNGFGALQRLTATGVAKCLEVFGYETFVTDRFLVVSMQGLNRFFDISAECAGIILYMAFLTVIFILPGYTLRARLIGFAFLPLIFAVNVFRILGSVWFVRSVSDNAALVYHDTISQVIIIGATFLCYLLWLFLIGKQEEKLSGVAV